MRRAFLLTISPLLLSLALLDANATAQTTHALTVGETSSVGCQNSQDPPTLDDGITRATAQLDFSYDATSGVLGLDVSNTSPVTTGVPNPVITRIAFNLPTGAVTGATLMMQTAAGGATPAFTLSVDTNLDGNANNKLGCLGEFNAVLAIPDVKGAIGNPDADTWSSPPGTVVIGPAHFDVQLDGPGIHTLTASNIALTLSQNGAFPANAAVKFQSGGVAGASGFIGSVSTGCSNNTWVSAPAVIGTKIDLCIGTAFGCHGCVFGSFTPGPVQVGPFTLPVGLPIIFEVLLPGSNGAPLCLPISIPADPTLVGQSLYLGVAAAKVGGAVQFSPALTISFQP